MTTTKDGNYAGSLSPNKALYTRHDLARYAAEQGVIINWREDHPRSSLKALRCLYALRENYVQRVSLLFYQAYWRDGRDFSQDDVILSILKDGGVANPQAALDKASTNHVKEMLQNVTQELVDRKGFGVPSFFVTIGDETEYIYGQDNIPRVKQRFGCAVTPVPRAAEYHGSTRKVELFFDYLSPWSYICTRRLSSMLGKRSLYYRPVVMKDMFKAVGIPKPMGPKKRAYMRRELFLQAKSANLLLKGNKNRGMTSELALRATITVMELDRNKAHKLVKRIFLAVWADGKNITDVGVLEDICNSIGLDGRQVLYKSTLPKPLKLLKENAKRAEADGVFGVPSMVVDCEGYKELFWGNDRVEKAVEMARDPPVRTSAKL